VALNNTKQTAKTVVFFAVSGRFFPPPLLFAVSAFWGVKIQPGFTDIYTGMRYGRYFNPKGTAAAFLLPAMLLLFGKAEALNWRSGLSGRTGLALESGLSKPVLTEKADNWTVNFPRGFLLKREWNNRLFGFRYFRSQARQAALDRPNQGAGFTFAARADADRLTSDFYLLSVEKPVASFWKFDNYLSLGLGLNEWKMTDASGRAKQLEDLNGRLFSAEDRRVVLAFGLGGEIYFSDYAALDVGGDFFYNTKILSRFRGERNIKNKNHYGLFNAVTGLHARLNFYFGTRRDSDGDGVPDKRDACANSFPGQVVDCDGCSLDGDADGIPDALDLCAGTPRGTAVDGDGCPVIQLSGGN
jgi:hypothetical protein